jgi:hypothetical protein
MIRDVQTYHAGDSVSRQRTPPAVRGAGRAAAAGDLDAALA